MFSHAAQLVSTLGAANLNELRLQVAQRHQSRFSSEGAGTGVSVNINGGTVNGVNNNINFGMPTGDGEDFVQRIYQVLDNYTMLRGNHSFKVGSTTSISTITGPCRCRRRHVPHRGGLSGGQERREPEGLQNFTQTVAILPEFDMTNAGFSAFIQDDWKTTPNLKLLYESATT